MSYGQEAVSLPPWSQEPVVGRVPPVPPLAAVPRDFRAADNPWSRFCAAWNDVGLSPLMVQQLVPRPGYAPLAVLRTVHWLLCLSRATVEYRVAAAAAILSEAFDLVPLPPAPIEARRGRFNR